MTVDTVKQELKKHLGADVTINYNLGRNKYEKYDVKIKKLYNHIFLVELPHQEIKTFAYTDVITKTIKIEY